DLNFRPLGPEGDPFGHPRHLTTRNATDSRVSPACPARFLYSPLLPRNELLEARVAAQGIEVRIDLQPAGREVVRNSQQRLESVEGLLRLADENVDPHELVPQVGNRDEGDAALTLPDRLLFPTEVRQREAEKNVALCIVGRCAKLLLVGLPGLLGIGVH